MDFTISETHLRVSDFLAQAMEVIKDLSLKDKLQDSQFVKQYSRAVINKLAPEELKLIVKSETDLDQELLQDLKSLKKTILLAAKSCDAVYKAKIAKKTAAKKSEDNLTQASFKKGKSQSYAAKAHDPCEHCGSHDHRFVWRKYNKKTRQVEWVKNNKCKKPVDPQREAILIDKGRKQMIEEYRKSKEGSVRSHKAETVNKEHVTKKTEEKDPFDKILSTFGEIKHLTEEQKTKLYGTLSGYHVSVVHDHADESTQVLNVSPYPTRALTIWIRDQQEKMIDIRGILDSGSNLTFMSKADFNKLVGKYGMKIQCSSLPKPLIIRTANGAQSRCYMTAKMDLIITVNLRSIRVHNVTVYIVDSPTWVLFLVGEEVLSRSQLMPEQNLPETPMVVDMDRNIETDVKQAFLDLEIEGGLDA
jgi:hypothetical protein